MKNKKSNILWSIFMITVICLSLINVKVALADNGTPTDVPPVTEVATDPPATDPPATEPAVIDTTTPVAPTDPATVVPVTASPEPSVTVEPSITYVAKAAPDATVGDLIAQAPENTDVVVLNQSGQQLPLASQEAANIAQTADPIWCPAGQPPTPGSNGCTSSFSAIADLLANMNNTDPTSWAANYSQNGVIYLEKTSGASTTITSSVAIDNTSYSNLFNNFKNYDLTIQGGWDTSTGTTAAQTTFDGAYLAIGNNTNPWIGSVTINNLTVQNVTSTTNASLAASSAGTVEMNNVVVTGSGAGQNNIEINASDAKLNNVKSSNSDMNGVEINTSKAGTVTLNNVVATNNGHTDGVNQYGSGVLVNGTSTLVEVAGGSYINNTRYGIEALNSTSTTLPIANIWTDQLDYAPGSAVTISGNDNRLNNDNVGFLTGETVHVDVTGPNGYTASCEATADAFGKWSCQIYLWATSSAEGDYSYTATGLTSGVTVGGTFKDALTQVLLGSQSPNPVAPGSTATYNVQVTNGSGSQTRRVSITSISGLPSGALLASSGCVSVPGDGNPYTIQVTVSTLGTTPIGTSSITMTATRWGSNGSCTNASGSLPGNGQLVVGLPKLNQTITFAAPASPATYNTSFTVSPTSDSGLTVTVTPSGSCSILGSTVTMTSGTGTCTLTASQAGNATYNVATNVVRTVTAQKANQTITFAAPASPAAYNSTFSISPTSDSGLTVTVTPSGSCSIAGSTVTMTSGSGTCTLTASQVGDTNYNAASNVVRTVAAQKADPTITFGAAPTPTYLGGNFTVSATTNSNGALTYSYVSGPCAFVSGATFSSSAPGTCVVQANTASTTNFNAGSTQQSVTIAKANQTITFAAPASPASYNTSFTVSPTSTSGLTVTVTPSGACSILGNTVTMTSGTGTCTLTASQAGNATYAAATNVVRTVTAQKINQTITFAAPASPATYNTTFSVSPTSTSGLTVTVTPSGACSILGSTVTMTSGTGTCTLTASQAGDTNYNAATNVVRTVTAQKASQTITFAAPASPATYNTSFTVSPTSTSALTVTVTPSGVCSILGSSVTMTSGTGTCTLTASQAGDTNYSAATNVVRTVTAQKANPTTNFGAAPTPTYLGGNFTVSATTNSDGTLTYSYVSGPCAQVTGATFSSNGAGTCVVQANTASTTNFNAGSVQQSVTIAKASQTITFAAPASPATYNTTFSVSPTSTSGLTVTVTPSGACSILGSTVTMTSGTGTCTLTASQAGNTNYSAAANVVRTVTAQKASQTITFAAPASPATYNTSFTVSPTSTSALTVTVTPSGVCSILGSSVTMTSGTGTCTLTASQAGDTNYNAASDVVRTVTAQKADQTITFAAPVSPATYNTNFSISPTSDSGLTVAVTPSGVCSLLGSTVTMTSGTGTCTLTASQAGNGNYNAATDVVRTVTAQKADQTITFAAPASPATYNTSFSISPTSDSGLTVAVTPSGVCSMLGSTVTMTSGTGTCTLTASQAGDTNYNAASDVVRTVTAQKAGQAITFAAPASPATYNTSFTVSLTSDSGLTVAVTPSGVCSILGSSVTMTSGTGTCTLTASQSGDDNYSAAADVVRTVTAQKASQTITFAAPASPATYNTSFSISPAASSGLTVTVTPSGVCSILGSSVTMTSGTGTCTLTASQSGDDNYSAAADVVRTVTAQKANPILTWNNWPFIFRNHALGSSQLNASASVPGAFVYSPASGTIMLNAGLQTLHVDFTPSDTTDYNTASKNVTILVVDNLSQIIAGLGGVIPVTGANSFDISCAAQVAYNIDPPGAHVSFNNLCGYQAMLNGEDSASLPGKVPDGNNFVDGLTVLVLQNDKALTSLPNNSNVVIDFPIPAGHENASFTAMFWNGSSWVEVPGQKNGAGFYQISTSQVGTFILVQK